MADSASADLRILSAITLDKTATATNGYVSINTTTFPSNSIPFGVVTNVWAGMYKNAWRIIATNAATTQGYQEFTNGGWYPFTP